MINVKNKKVIANISRRSLKANKSRNMIAICAIALTTILFTTLLTITGTILNSIQQSNFRQVGGDAYGSFKNVTLDQIDELSKDPLIKKYGKRLFLGMPNEAPFDKTHVEVSYMDSNEVDGSFCNPEQGRLPKENTNEIACDDRILSLLGIEPKEGAVIPLTYELGANDGDPQRVSDTFTLVGWWKHDEASQCSHALVPLSYAKEKMEAYVISNDGDSSGTWTMDIYLKSTLHIEKDMLQIMQNHGYQNEDVSKENYMGAGVNWAYAGAQLSNSMDAGTMVAIIAMLILFMLTGYLIIYNIFQISVANDIRFYGLLKTIGTTGKQIRRIITKQVLTLSIIGIPFGMLIGFIMGSVLSPFIMNIFDFKNTYLCLNPMIFVGSALFSLLTVFISCRKPGRTAGKVSPVEAVRFTEGSLVKRRCGRKKGNGTINIWGMAMANLGRNKKKTFLVVVSLSLAVVLLQAAVTFANGFDMDMYLEKNAVSDFILSYSGYFHDNNEESSNGAIETAVNSVNAMGGVTEGGYIYQVPGGVEDYVTEDYYRSYYGRWNTEETLDTLINDFTEKKGNLISDGVQLYGMEDFPLSNVNVIDGDISALHDKDENAIAAVYEIDDYGNPEPNTQWAKVGDQVTLNYVDEYGYFDRETGDQITNIEETNRPFVEKILKSHEVTYTVAATVFVKTSMSYRYWSRTQFILNADVLRRDAGYPIHILNYMFNTTKESSNDINDFLGDYTKKIDPTLDFESKQRYVKDFKEIQNMFMLMGSIMSFIVGLVGVLNFLNAIITSIMTRKHEFAMLQSIGMTGKQLTQMLMAEGLWYTIITIGISFLLSMITIPVFDHVISGIFWFFKYKINLLPFIMVSILFLIMGLGLPYIAYHAFSKDSIVERLRDVD